MHPPVRCRLQRTAGYSLVDGVGTVNGALFVPELATAAGGLLPIRTH
jgi:hypothetical protein